MGRRGRGTDPHPEYRVVSQQHKNVQSNEDWYPTIAGPPWPGQEGMVRVGLVEYGDDHWRVHIWGGDDFGFEQDFPVGEGAKALMEFDRIVNLTTQAELTARGFIRA